MDSITLGEIFLLSLVAIVVWCIEGIALNKVKTLEEAPEFSRLPEEKRADLQKRARRMRIERFWVIPYIVLMTFLIINSQFPLV